MVTCASEGRQLVTDDSALARRAAREGRYAVPVAPPRPPIVNDNMHDLTGYWPRADDSDPNAAVLTTVPGAAFPSRHAQIPCPPPDTHQRSGPDLSDPALVRWQIQLTPSRKSSGSRS